MYSAGLLFEYNHSLPHTYTYRVDEPTVVKRTPLVQWDWRVSFETQMLTNLTNLTVAGTLNKHRFTLPFHTPCTDFKLHGTTVYRQRYNIKRFVYTQLPYSKQNFHLEMLPPRVWRVFKSQKKTNSPCYWSAHRQHRVMSCLVVCYWVDVYSHPGKFLCFTRHVVWSGTCGCIALFV